jgi:NAD(P)H-dependent flavin oxidoreductase YrpB (nitropropane dioxygenase family)
MIKTRMTELFGIKHPIMLAGMNWVTEPELVAAVCNAGGLGVLATAATTPEETRKSIRQIRKLTDKPFGMVHRGGPQIRRESLGHHRNRQACIQSSRIGL